MFPRLRHIIRVIDARKFIRFCLVGLLNTAVDFGLFTLLTAVLNLSVYPSTFISQTAAIINSYFFNRKFTFKRQGYFKSSEFVRFAALNVVVLLIGQAGMLIFHGALGMNEIISKLPTTVLTMSVNYLGNQFWVFSAKRAAQDDVEK